MAQFVHLIAQSCRYVGYSRDDGCKFSPLETEFSFVTSLERGQEIFSLWKERQELSIGNEVRRNYIDAQLNKKELNNRNRQREVEARIDELCARKHVWHLITAELKFNEIGRIENIDQSVLLLRSQEAS